MINPDQLQADMAQLMKLPAFQRFLWRTIEASNILTSAYGADGRDLAYREGRRSLGFDVLSWADEGQPFPAPDGNPPIMTWISALTAAAQSTPEETKRGRRSTRNRDSSDDGRDDD